MPSGRPQVPAKIKELSGTIRKDRQKDVVKFELITSVPKPDSFLTPKAKRIFKDLCQVLIDKQLLDIANVPLVAIMAEEWATYIDACATIKKETAILKLKGGYKQAHPAVAIKVQALKNYKEVATLFGLDPLSSQKIGSQPKDEGDDFEKLDKQFN